MAQNPRPQAAAQAQVAPEIIARGGRKVAAASGRGPNSDIDVTVYRDLSLEYKLNGQFERNPDGSLYQTPDVVQIGARSSDASKLHLVQFYKQSEYDANGKEIRGGSVSEDRTVLHENGKWHVDMPLPPPGAKLDPDAVYYDHPRSRNLAQKTKTDVTMLDRPTEGTASPGAVRKEVEFKTYLVDDGGPRWEVNWKSTTTVDAQNRGHTTIGEIKGGPADKFADPINTKHWNIGNRVTPIKGTTLVKLGDTTEQALNPFFKK